MANDKPARIGVRHLICALAAIAAVALAVVEPPAGVTATGMQAAAITLVAIALFATALIPEFFTAIVFMFAAVVLAIAPPKIVFSGFYSSAVWLVFGGLVIGYGVQSSGFGARIVRLMLRFFPPSYFGTITAIAGVGAVLSFLIPSAMGRVVLLVPIVLVLAETLGFRKGSRGYAGLVLAATASTTIPAFGILPSNVPNMALIGGAESIYNVSFTYGAYLALNYPVMGLLGLAGTIALLTLFFGDTPKPAPADETQAPWSREERVLGLVVLIALALWASDFLHGVSPAWVAMGAAIVCLLPRVGIMPPGIIATKLNLGPWFFVAGIIGMGAVVTQSGFGTTLAQSAIAGLPFTQGGGAVNFASLVGLGSVVGILTTLPASPAIMTPLAETLAQATGWPLETVLLAQVPPWMAFPFPYQAPPIVVAMGLAGLTVGQVMRFLGPYLLFAIVVLLPLQYLWGNLLGFYP
ncbi:MAG: SLC13 family permease [Alphaproteobacteria bacterium]